MNLALSHCNKHANPLVTVLAPFGTPGKLINILEQQKQKVQKQKMYQRAIKKTKNNASSKEKGISQYLGYLPRRTMFNVVSLTFLQRTTLRPKKITKLLVTFHTLTVLPQVCLEWCPVFLHGILLQNMVSISGH